VFHAHPMANRDTVRELWRERPELEEGTSLTQETQRRS
jgi:hypothetical protein